MKLARVRIKEFRSILDSGEFTIDDITCLVGKNEAGKTAVLGSRDVLKQKCVNMIGYGFSLAGKLPGLFISPKPITKLKPEDDGCVLIPFTGLSPADVAEVIQKVRSIADNTLNWDFSNPYKEGEKSFGDRFRDALELKPGIGPLKIDLRKLFEK